MAFKTQNEPEDALAHLTEALHHGNNAGVKNVKVTANVRGGYKVRFDMNTGDSGYQMNIKRDPVEGAIVDVQPVWGSNSYFANNVERDVKKRYFNK